MNNCDMVPHAKNARENDKATNIKSKCEEETNKREENQNEKK